MSMESVVWAMYQAPTDGPLERLTLIYLANICHADESFVMPEPEAVAAIAGVPPEAVVSAVKRMTRRGLLDAHGERWYIASPSVPPVPVEPGRASKAAISPADRDWTYARDRYQCLRCGGRDLTIDHVVPESLGGTTTRDNFQTLCRGCNSWKGTRTGAEFDYRSKEADS